MKSTLDMSSSNILICAFNEIKMHGVKYDVNWKQKEHLIKKLMNIEKEPVFEHFLKKI